MRETRTVDQVRRKTSSALALISHERVIEVIRRVRAMRLMRDFFPSFSSRLGEHGIAFEVGGNLGDDQLVRLTQILPHTTARRRSETLPAPGPARRASVRPRAWWPCRSPRKRRVASRVTTMLRRPGNGRPIDSCVLRPMMMGAPIVVRLKNARSSGSRQGNWLSRPITPLSARATIRVSVVIEWKGERNRV